MCVLSTYRPSKDACVGRLYVRPPCKQLGSLCLTQSTLSLLCCPVHSWFVFTTSVVSVLLCDPCSASAPTSPGHVPSHMQIVFQREMDWWPSQAYSLCVPACAHARPCTSLEAGHLENRVAIPSPTRETRTGRTFLIENLADSVSREVCLRSQGGMRDEDCHHLFKRAHWDTASWATTFDPCIPCQRANSCLGYPASIQAPC